MKLLRILLLALLAFTLPVRGVMAAAMLCAPATQTSGPVHAHAGHDGHTGEASRAHMHVQQHEGGHHHAADHEADGPAAPTDDGAAAGADTCHLCSACCSTPPLAGNPPTLALAHALGTSAFPSLAAPAPDFVSEGPERPPRSI